MDTEKLTVMIAEDDPPLLRALWRDFERFGWTVYRADSHRQASLMLRGESHLDVVLTDYDLGDGTGLSVRTMAAMYRIPSVLYTGADIHAPDMLTKPQDSETIRDKLLEVYKRGLTHTA